MAHFSAASQAKLNVCDETLKELFEEVVKNFDCTILDSHRNEKDQNSAFASGASKLKFPNSKHNSLPANAVDVAPFIAKSVCLNTDQCYFFGGYVLGIAEKLGIRDHIRWGGDWDSDFNIEQSFNDLVHFEIK